MIYLNKFHEACIDIWLQSNTTCPICIQPFNYFRGYIDYDYLLKKHSNLHDVKTIHLSYIYTSFNFL